MTNYEIQLVPFPHQKMKTKIKITASVYVEGTTFTNFLDLSNEPILTIKNDVIISIRRLRK